MRNLSLLIAVFVLFSAQSVSAQSFLIEDDDPSDGITVTIQADLSPGAIFQSTTERAGLVGSQVVQLMTDAFPPSSTPSGIYAIRVLVSFGNFSAYSLILTGDRNINELWEDILPGIILNQMVAAAVPTLPPSSISWANNHFVYCHLPACALWDMRGTGGSGASTFNIKRALSSAGPYVTIQTETSISYFNVHGGDKNMYWKICGVGAGGETCSPYYRTRIECETGGGGNPLW